jgi:TonB family protein
MKNTKLVTLILLFLVTMLTVTACDQAANSPADTRSIPANAAAVKPTEAETKPAAPAPAGKEIKSADGPALKSITPPDDTILGGVLNDLATSLPAPDPAAAKEANASGKVTVEILVNEKGEVSASSVVSGPQPLWKAAGAAARQARFAPPLKDGKPVKVAGVLVYDFAK